MRQVKLQTSKVSKSTAARVLTNGGTIFTVTGDIEIVSLVSECIATGTPAANTIQWQSAPAVGAAATFTGASASLASVVAGSSVSVLSGQTTAPSIVVSGANNEAAYPLTAFCPTGTIKTVIGSGPSTSTWVHYICYIPLEDGAEVVAA